VTASVEDASSKQLTEKSCAFVVTTMTIYGRTVCGWEQISSEDGRSGKWVQGDSAGGGASGHCDTALRQTLQPAAYLDLEIEAKSIAVIGGLRPVVLKLTWPR
jgi:hypothetical protein